MSSEGGGNRFGGFPLKLCLMVLGISALVALCVYVSIQKSLPGMSTSSSPVASPTKSSQYQEDVPSKDEDLSSQAKPSVNEIWDFESAYNTVDPTEQLKLLQKVATTAYIDSEYSATSIDVNKLIIRVNRKMGSFSVEKGPQNAYCVVTTIASLESSRDGKLVASYSAPSHTTVWINTKAGWRVASEVR